MKNKLALLLIGITSLALTSCTINSNKSDSEFLSSNNTTSVSDSSTSNPNRAKDDVLLAETYSNLVDLSNLHNKLPDNWDEAFADSKNFNSATKITYEQAYKNNILVDGNVTISNEDDVKFLFYNKNDNSARIISKADGYALTLPTSTTLNTDFSLGLYRSKVYNEDYTLTISYEHSNPYSNWNTYRKEWLFRYLDNDNYYLQNNLSLLCTPKKNDIFTMSGYTIDEYDLVINNPNKIRKNYYNIAAIRPANDNTNFVMLVMKSTHDMTEEFEDIIFSYKRLDKEGTANNSSFNGLKTKYNPSWSDETKQYYTSLLDEDRTNWGAFVATLPESSSTHSMTKSQLERHTAYKKFNDLCEALDYPLDILPTYQHIAWNRQTVNYWPTTAANVMAGGNGFNGKPVIQMSYQFTDNNNNVSVANTKDCYTPVFDIYRGDDGDDPMFSANPQARYAYKLKSIAKNIKEYGKPVLFRLNNEMNTDWTSYCGMMTLLDPDIFQATWRLMYNIFEEVGVDNCIWIFNPIAVTCPFSSWGEDLCYYPGIDYVQALGLTYYEPNNDKIVSSTTFRQDYTELYEKNYPVWQNYPWIISEFGCGAGGETDGERYRNQDSQVEYVKGMFNDFNDRANHPYLQNIKGAVWFSVNDYVNDDKGNLLVINQFELEIGKLDKTINAMKEGLAPNKRS